LRAQLLPIIRASAPKTASGAVNARYLASIPASWKAKILKAVANHYGVSVREIEKELVDPGAEELYEYLAFDRSMAMTVYREFQRGRFASDKTAVGKDTADFIEWVFNVRNKPWDAQSVQNFVRNLLGVQTSPPVKKRTGPRFRKGDQVRIDSKKHSYPTTMAPYKTHHGQLGVVTEVDGKDVLVSFRGSAPVRFEGGNMDSNVGIFKYVESVKPPGPMFELVYLAGGRRTRDQKVTVDYYMGGAKKNERRSANYATGYAYFASTGKNGWYFRAIPQQRLIDPTSEAGFRPTSYNPKKGKVLYIGVAGRRPAGWKEELENARANAAMTEEELESPELWSQF